MTSVSQRVKSGRFFEARTRWERQYWERAVSDRSKTITEIARQEGVNRSYVYHMLKLLGIEPQRPCGNRGDWLGLA